jgi:hypothetical protein
MFWGQKLRYFQESFNSYWNFLSFWRQTYLKINTKTYFHQEYTACHLCRNCHVLSLWNCSKNLNNGFALAYISSHSSIIFIWLWTRLHASKKAFTYKISFAVSQFEMEYIKISIQIKAVYTWWKYDFVST